MILGCIITFFVGMICIVLGICNAKGNISSIHFYHRHRVSEQDRLSFGRLVGAGTIIIGTAIILLGISILLAELINIPSLVFGGSALFSIGLLAGMFLSFYAMIKYNKGIF